MILEKMTKSPRRVSFHRPADNANPSLACSFGSGQYLSGRTPSAGPRAVGGTNTSGSGGWLSLLDCQQLSSHITLGSFFFFQLKTRHCLTAQQTWSSHAGPSLPPLSPRVCLLSPAEMQTWAPQPHELLRGHRGRCTVGWDAVGRDGKREGATATPLEERVTQRRLLEMTRPQEQQAATAPS